MNELEQFKTVHGVSWSLLDTGGNSMELKTTAIRAIKQEVRLQEWSAQIKAQQTSGMTVRQWCAENGIKPATYYYHLRLLREQCIEKMPAINRSALPEENSVLWLLLTSHSSLLLQISLPMRPHGINQYSFLVYLPDLRIKVTVTFWTSLHFANSSA